jgi:hypothetical protein
MMNIKLKAMLYTAAILLGFVGVSCLIFFVLLMYPLVAAVILIIVVTIILIGMIYQITLETLMEK